MVGYPEFNSVANYPHWDLDFATHELCNMVLLPSLSLSMNNGAPEEGCWAGLCGCGRAHQECQAVTAAAGVLICLHRAVSLPPPLPSSKDEKGSVLMLGGVDPSYYHGELHWVPVSKPSYWQLAVDR